MMKYYLFCVLFLMSCTAQPNKDILINLEVPEKTEFVLSEMADSISYYPLITEANAQNPRRVELLKEKIWVNYVLKDYSDEKGSLFDRKDGKLINSISFGHILGGRGRKYDLWRSHVNTIFVFENEDDFTAPPFPNTKSVLYTLSASTGIEKESIPFSALAIRTREPQRINDSIVLLVREQSGFSVKNEVKPHSTIQWLDTQMNLIKEDVLNDSIFLINRDVFVSLLRGKVYLHAHCTNTIYEISCDKKPKVIYRYHLGKYAPELKKINELFKEKDGGWTKFYKLPCYHLHSSYIADNYIFSAYDYEGMIHYVLFDRRMNKVWTIPTKGIADGRVYSRTEGIKNDLDGGLDFWPKAVSKQGEIYTWYTVEELKTKLSVSDLKDLKNPGAAKKLKAMLANLPEEVSIIVAVLNEKG